METQQLKLTFILNHKVFHILHTNHKYTHTQSQGCEALYIAKSRSASSVTVLGFWLQCLYSLSRKNLHLLLTVSTASPTLEHKAIWHGTVSTQRRQLPVADDDGWQAPGEDQ